MKTFDTTIIDLASAILTEVPGTALEGIDRTHRVNGKSLIRITYPPEQEERLLKIQHDFNDRKLLIRLYEFNGNRRLITNQLFGRGGRWDGKGYENR